MHALLLHRFSSIWHYQLTGTMCVRACTCVCMDTHTHTYVCIYISIYILTYTYRSIDQLIYTHNCIRMYVYAYIYMITWASRRHLNFALGRYPYIPPFSGEEGNKFQIQPSSKPRWLVEGNGHGRFQGDGNEWYWQWSGGSRAVYLCRFHSSWISDLSFQGPFFSFPGMYPSHVECVKDAVLLCWGTENLAILCGMRMI